jgi:hypothetical protein
MNTYKHLKEYIIPGSQSNGQSVGHSFSNVTKEINHTAYKYYYHHFQNKVWASNTSDVTL